MRRLSLAVKIFLGTAGIVTAILVVTLLVTSASARNSAEVAVARGLSETNARIADQLAARQEALAGRMAIFADNRNAVQTIALDTAGNNALDQARVLVESSGATWVQITDGQGVRKAKSDEPAAEKIDLARSPLVSGALGGKVMRGFGVSGDTAVLQLVAVPLLRDLTDSASVIGVLMAAEVVGDSLARAIGKATGSDVAFYVLDRNDSVHVAGATMAADQKPSLQRQIAERRRGRSGVDSAGGATTAAAGRTPRAAMVGDTSAKTSLTLRDTTFVGQETPLLSASGKPVGGFLAMRSLDAELGGFYALRKQLLLTGAIALIVAFIIAGAITRQIVRPVTALVSATRRAADGDYNAEIPAHGDDEIGTLAEAVRRLLKDLREKQALVDFLSGGGSAPDGMQTVARSPDATQLIAGSTARLDGSLKPGQTLGGRYDIKAMLGAGGMGMVYRAVDRELQEVVAIKTLKPEMVDRDPTALERFKSEIRLARKISHRNVVRTHDLGESQGLYFITMELVEGTSLKELLRTRGRMPANVMLPIAKQLCRALEVAHEEGVIHRDIKPQNMVVEGNGTLKVMDFGIARLAARAPQAGLTEAGMVIGTPEYMSPEQLLGEELDPRADIYSAGVVMYECLIGHPPFEALSPIVLITRVLEDTPPTPSSLHADIPPAVSALVMQALARDRTARPATAKALHDALEQIG